jgi:hypothetical protein
MAGTAELKRDEEPYAEEVRALLLRAQQGDVGVLDQLRELLDDRPELWKRLGDLVGHVEEALLALASGKSLLARESIRRRMDELRAELAGSSPWSVAKLLVDRVVVCWAQCHLADLEALQKAQAGQARGEADRRQTEAQSRCLAAVKQLAMVRKRLKPAPSPLEMLRAPVGEAKPAPSHPRMEAGLPLCGVGVGN